MGDNEAFYDAEIAPALADIATKCHARGMSFLATVEYQPGERGDTGYLTGDCGIAMDILRVCMATTPNVDAFVIALKRFAKERGIDTSASFVLNPHEYRSEKRV